jgi:hypothetical protein
VSHNGVSLPQGLAHAPRPSWPAALDSEGADIGAVVTWSNAHTRRVPRSMRASKVELRPGEHFHFGVSNRSGTLEPYATHSVGALEIAADYWSISNFTANSTFVVENLEGGAELVKVAPRRLGMVIPFEMSRLLVPSWNGLIELTVFGTPPALLEEHLVTDAPECSLVELDETSKYFLVLVALCEPRLRGSSMSAVPAVQEVVERLRGIDQFKDANRSSINYHIDYLRERKLPVDQWSAYLDGGRMHSKREAIVSFALRHNLVREEHLDLLPTSDPKIGVQPVGGTGQAAGGR